MNEQIAAEAAKVIADTLGLKGTQVAGLRHIILAAIEEALRLTNASKTEEKLRAAQAKERRIPEQSSDNMSPEAHPDTGIAPSSSGDTIVYYDYLGRGEVKDK